MINWLKNAYPVRGQGQGGRQVRIGKQCGEIFDHHYVEFEYADGTRMFSQCRHIRALLEQCLRARAGDEGAVPTSAAVIEPAKMRRRSRRRGATRDVRVNPYQVEHDDLFASIRAGKPINEAEFGA